MEPGIRILYSVALVATLQTIIGCNAPNTTVEAEKTTDDRIIPQAARPVATWQNQRITISEIEPALLELAGTQILQEEILERAVALAAAREDIALTEQMISRERTMLLESLSPDPDRAERLLIELRNARGLGPRRFDAMLRRSALLRAMVSNEVVLEERVIRGAWDAEHGAKRIARIIAVEDLVSAGKLRRQIDEGEDFARLAAEFSMDRSAPRGGLLAPVSQLDPSWPEPFRVALFQNDIGGISNPILVEGRYLLLRIEREEPATGVAFEQGRDAAEQTARLAAERILMDRLARRLARSADLKVIDQDIRWREE